MATPAINPMCATPCTALPDFGFVCWSMPVQIFAIIRYCSQLVSVDMKQRIGESHIAVLMMVAVGLSVSGDMNDLRAAAMVRKSGSQTVGQILASVQQAF